MYLCIHESPNKTINMYKMVIYKCIYIYIFMFSCMTLTQHINITHMLITLNCFGS